MPLGIVNDSEFENEVKNSCIINHERPERTIEKSIEFDPDGQVIITSDVIIKKHHEHGRNEHDVNVPQSLRKLIGDTATFEGRPAGLQLANEFGISNPSVDGYTNPHNSNLSETNKNDISEVLNFRKQKISKRAINKLSLAISMIDESKLASCKATELSSVAKDMAQVAKHMELETIKDDESKKPVFVMYAPQIHNENKYQTVIAKDNY